MVLFVEGIKISDPSTESGDVSADDVGGDAAFGGAGCFIGNTNICDSRS